jgi:hypothetical protein
MNPDREQDGKARKLVGKLVLGGTKLTLIFFSRVIWGVASSPLASMAFV